MATVHIAPVVNYHGTLTRMHGIWYLAGQTSDTRHNLTNFHHERIRNARRQSFTIINTPGLSIHRAEALINLTHHRTRPDTRTLNWLIKHGLAEVGDGKPTPTMLGANLACAVQLF